MAAAVRTWEEKVPFKYMKYVFTEMPLVLHQRFRVNHLGFQRAFNQLTGCSKVSLRRKSLSCLHELDLWVDWRRLVSTTLTAVQGENFVATEDRFSWVDHLLQVSLLWLVVGPSNIVQSADPSRGTKLRSNCQTRHYWSNMTHDSVTALLLSSDMFRDVCYSLLQLYHETVCDVDARSSIPSPSEAVWFEPLDNIPMKSKMTYSKLAD